MKTKTQALYEFFNSFGLTAYPTTAVPEEMEFPWMTYDCQIGNPGDTTPSTGTLDLWYHTESEALPNAKADEIAKAIGLGGNIILCEDGAIWIKRGTPWCVTVPTDDNSLKRRTINLDIEYL